MLKSPPSAPQPDTVTESETSAFKEFFDGTNPNKTPEIYKSYRNFMISEYAKNPKSYLSVTKCRQLLNGDAMSIFHLHSHLEKLGLINYAIDPRNTPQSLVERIAASKRKKVGSIIHQVEREPETLGEKLYLFSQYSQQYQGSQTSNWSEKEELELLDAVEMVTKMGQPTKEENWSEKEPGASGTSIDWEKVAEKLPGKTKEQCLVHFLQMPLKEQFFPLIENQIVGNMNTANTFSSSSIFGEDFSSLDDTNKFDKSSASSDFPLPFSDTSNPIMSTVAFLFSIVNRAVSGEAANEALMEIDRQLEMYTKQQQQQQNQSPNSNTSNFIHEMNIQHVCLAALKAAVFRSSELAFKEERSIQRLVACCIEKQIKKIEIKIKQLEKIEELQKSELKKIEES